MCLSGRLREFGGAEGCSGGEIYGLIVGRGKGVLQRMQGHGEVKNAQGLGLWMKRGAERPKGRSRTWTWGSVKEEEQKGPKRTQGLGVRIRLGNRDAREVAGARLISKLLFVPQWLMRYSLTLICPPVSTSVGARS